MTDMDDADGRELPVDVAAWIDEHDVVLPGGVSGSDHEEAVTVEATVEATQALEEQRAEHEPPSREATDAIGPLVNNTGDDGGAASG